MQSKETIDKFISNSDTKYNTAIGKVQEGFLYPKFNKPGNNGEILKEYIDYVNSNPDVLEAIIIAILKNNFSDTM